MAKSKQKHKKIKSGLKIFLIFSGIILIPMLLIAKSKIDEYNDRKAMEETLVHISGLYGKFTLAVPEQEKLAYRPENTCAYISHLWAGYTCQVKGSARYDGQSVDLGKIFQYIDEAIDPNIFIVINKEPTQAYENRLYQVYKVKDKNTHMECSISGMSEIDKVWVTFLCEKHSNFLLYGFEDDRKDRALYSD